MLISRSLKIHRFLPALFLWLLTLSGLRATTLSDNLSVPTAFTEVITSSTWITAGFATDNSSYTLASVTALMMSDTPGPVTMSLYSKTSSAPGKPLGTLISPSSFSSTGLSPAIFGGNSVTLLPNTTYWIVLSSSGVGQYEWAYANDNTGTGPGFLHSWGYSLDAGSSWFTSDLQPTQMRVDANATMGIPEPGAGGLLIIGLGLIGIVMARHSTHEMPVSISNE